MLADIYTPEIKMSPNTVLMIKPLKGLGVCVFFDVLTMLIQEQNMHLLEFGLRNKLILRRSIKVLYIILLDGNPFLSGV